MTEKKQVVSTIYPSEITRNYTNESAYKPEGAQGLKINRGLMGIAIPSENLIELWNVEDEDNPTFVSNAGANSIPGNLYCDASGLLSEFQAALDGSYTIPIDGDSKSILGYDGSLDTSFEDVASNLQVGVRAIGTGGFTNARVYTTDSTQYTPNKFIFISGTLSPLSSVGLLSPAASGTDISNSTYLNGTSGQVNAGIAVNNLIPSLSGANGIDFKNDNSVTYVISQSGGSITSLDTSGLPNIIELDSLAAFSSPRDLAVDDINQVVYMADAGSGDALQSIDVSDPSNLGAISTTSVGGNMLSVSLIDNYAVGAVNNINSIVLIDKTNKLSPVLSDTYQDNINLLNPREALAFRKDNIRYVVTVGRDNGYFALLKIENGTLSLVSSFIDDRLLGAFKATYKSGVVYFGCKDSSSVVPVDVNSAINPFIQAPHQDTGYLSGVFGIESYNRQLWITNDNVNYISQYKVDGTATHDDSIVANNFIVAKEMTYEGQNIAGNVLEKKTTDEINSIESPDTAKMLYDEDVGVGRVYDPNTPIDNKWNEFGVNNEGIVKINGYYSNPVSCTFSTGTNLVNATSHGLINDDKVSFKDGTGSLPDSIIIDREYVVINSLTNTFQISEASGGDPIVFSETGTAGTVFFKLVNSSDIIINAVGGEPAYISYPDDVKLSVSSVTIYPYNQLPLDDNFYNNSIVSGTFTGDTTSGSAIVANVNDLTNVSEGMKVSGTGIPSGSLVKTIDSPTQFTMSQDATVTNATVSLTFRKNKFLENSSNLQATPFRVRATYTKSSSANVETVQLILFNPLSGFILSNDQVIRKQATSGFLTFIVIPISDSNSLGEGTYYILFPPMMPLLSWMT